VTGSRGPLPGTRPPEAAGTADETWFRPVFLALLALQVVPLWTTRFLPMTDLPQHLGLIWILHNLNDPSFRFHEYFAVRPGLRPYGGYYWVADILTYLMPLETANRLLLTAYAAGLAGSAVWLARAAGRSRWLALFALPLTCSYEFYVGFVSHLAAVALMVGALAAYATRLQGGIPGRRWDVALVALPLACMATHVLPYSFFVASLGVMIAVFPGRRVHTLARAAPSLAVFTWSIGSFLRGHGGGAISLEPEPLLSRLAGFDRAVLNQFRGGLDSAILLALAAVWVWGLAAARGGPAIAGPRGRRWLLPILAAGALGGYLFMPTHLLLAQFIAPRYATMFCLLLALSAPLAEGTPPRTWRSALVALCAASALYVGMQFHRFDREAGDFRALAQKVEAGSCVGTILGYMDSGVMNLPGMYNHFGLYLTVWRGAIPGYTFAGESHIPLVYLRRDGSPAAWYHDAALPVIREDMPAYYIEQGTLFPAYGGFYRYFLVPRSRDIRDLFGDYASILVKVGEAGPLALYLNPAGGCGR